MATKFPVVSSLVVQARGYFGSELAQLHHRGDLDGTISRHIEGALAIRDAQNCIAMLHKKHVLRYQIC